MGVSLEVLVVSMKLFCCICCSLGWVIWVMFMLKLMLMV